MKPLTRCAVSACLSLERALSRYTSVMENQQNKHWLVRAQTIRRLWMGFGVVLGGLVLADAFIHGHPSFGLDGTFGFYAWYGLATCAAMVIAAKVLGALLKRPDTYYDDHVD